jgi:hypothetical protein
MPLTNHAIVKLDPTRSSFSEIIWRLSRLRDRGRITPGQHPFFYSLPISENEYDNEFELHPIEDFQAVFNHDVYVLVDKPGRIFIESGTRKLTFGNVWMPKHTLIFKGTFSPHPSSHSHQHLARRLRHTGGGNGRWAGPASHSGCPPWEFCRLLESQSVSFPGWRRLGNSQ